jgi:hypothetical protein
MKKTGIVLILVGILLFIGGIGLLFQNDMSVCSIDMRTDLLAFCKIGVLSNEDGVLLGLTIFVPSCFMGLGTFALLELNDKQ